MVVFWWAGSSSVISALVGRKSVAALSVVKFSSW
jgi:hypothetical protein